MMNLLVKNILYRNLGWWYSPILPVMEENNMVATAKAYLNRSKFSKAVKQKIAACINRKAKELGCKVGKKAKVKGSIDNLADSSVFASTKLLVEESLKNKDMDLIW